MEASLRATVCPGKASADLLILIDSIPQADRIAGPESAGQATYSGMVPEHGPLFLRPDGRGQGISALRPRDFGHHSLRWSQCHSAR